MLYIILLGILFVVMLLLPFISATWYFKRKRGEILQINPQNARDARYFGKSFGGMVEKKLETIEGNEITLSRKETFLDGDSGKGFTEEVDKMVLCLKKEFVSPAQVRSFQKEVYCRKAARFTGGGLSLRAVCGREKVLLEQDTHIIRWVDAEQTLAVYENCELGQSASAGRRMSIGEGCTFKRLYAPEILLGQYPGGERDLMADKDSRIFRMPVQMDQERNMRYISREMINEEGVVDFTILSWRNVTVIENVIVQGDVRSHKGVRLCDGAVVCGNIFAEEDVYLGRNASVLGNLFTQGSVYLEEGSMVGQRERICSLIARERITFEKNTCVFGYVSCEKGGKVVECPSEKREERKPEFLDWAQSERELRFMDLADYENVDQQGFRKNAGLRSVVLPKGAYSIPTSMFFQCSGLETAELPATLEDIEAYAFADCGSLTEVVGLEKTKVESIGTSAFENCAKLTKLFLPRRLRFLGGAAFAGCGSLQEVVFPAEVERLGDHCFRDCKKLRRVELPDSVTYIGVSCFAGCDSLQEISLPYACREEKGVKELTEQGSIHILYRHMPVNGEETDET